MNRNKLFLIAAGATFIASAILLLSSNNQVEKQYEVRNEGYNATTIKHTEALLIQRKSNINTGKIEPSDYYTALAKVNSHVPTKAAGLKWDEMGPDNVGGRTRALIIFKEDPNIIYAGSVSGGLWKSTDASNSWNRVAGFDDNQSIGAMERLGNGTILVGTGNTWEGGFVGNGLYISTDGATFAHAQDQNGNDLKPTSATPGNDFTVVNRLIADPKNPNGVYLAYNDGIRYYDTQTKMFTVVGGFNSGTCQDIAVSTDGNTIAAIISNKAQISTDGGATFTSKTPSISGGSGFSRAEIDIDPDNKDHIFMSVSKFGNNGTFGGQFLEGVYESSDAGNNWNKVWYGTASGVNNTDPFGTGQGTYDHILAVVPNSGGKIYLGGVQLWERDANGIPKLSALNFANPGNPLYVHSDIHEIKFDANGVMYIGSDGGIFRSDDGGQSFRPSNRGFNITQFYSVAFSSYDEVLGGLQDNGTQLITQKGNTKQEAREILGGDGFDANFSQINNNILFGSLYFGDIRRSDQKGANNTMSLFYDQDILALGTPGSLTGNGIGPFHTVFRLHEKRVNPNSRDTMVLATTEIYSVGANVLNGDTIFYNSRNGGGSLYTVATQDIVKTITIDTMLSNCDTINFNPVTVQCDTTFVDSLIVYQDTLRLPNTVTSLMAAGFNGNQGLWITRDALDFDRLTDWHQIDTTMNGRCVAIEFSEDGNHVFYATPSRLHRASGLDFAYTPLDFKSIEGVEIYSSGTTITGLDVDPNDPDHVVITLGNYGTNTHVLESNNATGAATFTSIQGDLPSMPAYDVAIDKEDPNVIVVGTEFGVWTTDNGGTNWTQETDAISNAPVYAVRQQRLGSGQALNPGTYYVGTYGRGIFKSETRRDSVITSIEDKAEINKLGLSIYPNPLSENGFVKFNLATSSTVNIEIFSLNGKLIKAIERKNVNAGDNRIEFNMNSLSAGTYLLRIRAGNKTEFGKFIKL